MEYRKLRDGSLIPVIGFGTCALGAWQQDDDYVISILLKAIKSGYRHFDTASLYGNERSLGKAIKSSGIPRQEFYISTKIWDTEQGYNEVIAACEASLARLGLDYIDLYIIHWPYPEKMLETWAAMEALHRQGLIKSPGLSNFQEQDIEYLLKYATIPPVYNQVELHPYLTQGPLVTYCETRDIAISCWAPLGSGTWTGVPAKEKPLSNETITRMAIKYKVTNGQVILKWDIQQGRIVIPKAESDKNMMANLDLFSFELSEQELSLISSLNANRRFGAGYMGINEHNMKIAVPE